MVRAAAEEAQVERRPRSRAWQILPAASSNAL